MKTPNGFLISIRGSSSTENAASYSHNFNGMFFKMLNACNERKVSTYLLSCTFSKNVNTSTFLYASISLPYVHRIVWLVWLKSLIPLIQQLYEHFLAPPFAHIIRWKDEHKVNELPFSTFPPKNLCLKRVNESCSDIIT